MATRLPPPEPPASDEKSVAPPADPPPARPPDSAVAPLPSTSPAAQEAAVVVLDSAPLRPGWEQDLFVEVAATVAARMKRHGAALSREEAREAVVSARTLVEVAREEV